MIENCTNIWWIKVYSVLWLLSFHFIHIFLKWKVLLFESFLKQSPFFLQNHVFWEEVFKHQTKHLTWFVRESFGGKQFSCIQNSILLDYSIFWSLPMYWLDLISRPHSFESTKSSNHFIWPFIILIFAQWLVISRPHSFESIWIGWVSILVFVDEQPE